MSALPCSSLKFSKILSLDTNSSWPAISVAVRSLMNSIQRGVRACQLSVDDVIRVKFGDVNMSIISHPMKLTIDIQNLPSTTTSMRTRSLRLTSRRNETRTRMYVSVHDADAGRESKRGNIHEVFSILKYYQRMPLHASIFDSDSNQKTDTQLSFSFSGRPSIDRSFSKTGK